MDQDLRDFFKRIEIKLEMLFNSDKSQGEAIAGIGATIDAHNHHLDNWKKEEQQKSKLLSDKVSILEKRVDSIIWKFIVCIAIAASISAGITKALG